MGIQGVNQYTGLSHCSGINQNSRGGEGRKVGKWEKFKRFLGGEIGGFLIMDCKWRAKEGK